MNAIAIGTAFVGGLVSFFAPCVLPIVPGFLAYLAGSSTTVQGGAAPSRRSIFLSSLFFVLGFSVVFALLGVVLSTVFAHIAGSVQIWLSRFGGAVIIIFGLYLVGLLHIGFFDRTHQMKIVSKSGPRFFVSFLFGLAFAAGWTPCVGPVLAGIIGLSAAAPGSAFVLFLAYAIGLGIPFLLVGAFTAQASAYMAKRLRLFSLINKVFGVILVVLGILVFTGTLASLADVGVLNNLLLS